MDLYLWYFTDNQYCRNIILTKSNPLRQYDNNIIGLLNHFQTFLLKWTSQFECITGIAYTGNQKIGFQLKKIKNK
jgi:hypothetical protein